MALFLWILWLTLEHYLGLETIFSWSLGHGFKEITTWHSYGHQNPNFWLCYYGTLWLTFWTLVWSSKPSLWAHVLGYWLWNFMLCLKTLIREYASWNPNLGCLVLVFHLRLTFDHGIEWNPSSLERGSWPCCPTYLHLTYMSIHMVFSSF